VRRSAGFTLIELLSAIAIFAILAGMLFQMIRGSLDIWRMGEGERESQEKGQLLLNEIAAELRMIRADSAPGDSLVPVRLISDYGLFDLNLDQKDDSVLQRLRFVRSCPEELMQAGLRRAGDLPGGTARSSDTEVTSAQARAPGGLAEVAYATLRLPEKNADPALLSLYRLFRTPIGGDDSLFASKLLDRPQQLEREALPLADNVLFLGFEFWSRETRGWSEPPDQEGGPLTVWDSTRGSLLERRNFNSFLLAKSAESERQPDDDVFPRRIRVTLVLARDEDESATATLKNAVGSVSKTILVENLAPFSGGSEVYPYLKIDGEWMRFSPGAGSELKVIRGQRRTVPMPHEPGARIHRGRTFSRVVEIPVYRENWNDS